MKDQNSSSGLYVLKSKKHTLLTEFDQAVDWTPSSNTLQSVITAAGCQVT